MQALRQWSLWLPAVMVVIAVGCSSSEVSFEDARSHDFLGVVVDAELHEDWRLEPAESVWSTGHDGRTRVGPATVRLRGGEKLEISAGTPGGNACPDLIRAEDVARLEAIPVDEASYDTITQPTPSQCVLIGERDTDGAVSWFQVLHEISEDGSHVEFGSAMPEGPRRARVQEGFVFPLAQNVTINCLPGEGLDSPEDVFTERAGRHVSHVSIDTGNLTELSCIYSE